MIYPAAQLGIDPGSGEIAPGGIKAETARALLNIEAILVAAGSSLENIVKVTVFLNDLTEYNQMNSVYRSFFGDSPPARSAIQAKLPKEAKVEIEAIAIVDKSEAL